ncbi:MAG: SH3 domain-containing protein [Paracoccaceae bacterium]|nr:SH3 domain-containing protein [Paracoccaceae bacterium]
MRNLILVSFGFLALAFYELSGGADFDPVAARNAAVLARMDPDETSRTIDTASAEVAEPEAIEERPSVTRMALNLTSFEDVANARQNTPSQPILAKPAERPIEIVPLASPKVIDATTVTFDSTPDENGVLPSIIFSGSRSQASSENVTTRRDIRFVAGAIVNMRGGPGTGFDVVTKLNRDTEVEVLQDDGSGWIRLRPVSGGPEGWIADYLLTNG